MTDQSIGASRSVEGGQGGGGGEQVKAVERVGLLAEHVPQKARSLARVMMQDQLGVVEVGFARNRAHAEAADVFDAALSG